MPVCTTEELASTALNGMSVLRVSMSNFIRMHVNLAYLVFGWSKCKYATGSLPGSLTPFLGGDP